MLAAPDTRVRAREGVVHIPVLRVSGEVATGRYDARSRLLQVVDDEVLTLARELPPRPNADERESALAYLWVEVLGDFPFARQSDRTHALATLLLPVMRHFIDGPSPLHLIEAPSEGTGKSLLADVVQLVATGERAQPTPLSTREEELRKKGSSGTTRLGSVMNWLAMRSGFTRFGSSSPGISMTSSGTTLARLALRTERR